MQTTNDVFINLRANRMKSAERLDDNSKQISGKTKLLGVKRDQPPSHITKVTERTKSSIFRLFLG